MNWHTYYLQMFLQLGFTVISSLSYTRTLASEQVERDLWKLLLWIFRENKNTEGEELMYFLWGFVFIPVLPVVSSCMLWSAPELPYNFHGMHYFHWLSKYTALDEGLQLQPQTLKKWQQEVRQWSHLSTEQKAEKVRYLLQESFVGMRKTLCVYPSHFL